MVVIWWNTTWRMEILASKPQAKTWQESRMLPETTSVKLILTGFKVAIETRFRAMCQRVSKSNLCANSQLLVIQTNLLRPQAIWCLQKSPSMQGTVQIRPMWPRDVKCHIHSRMWRCFTLWAIMRVINSNSRKSLPAPKMHNRLRLIIW